jgi:membrane associated rhomboid family serine protease
MQDHQEILDTFNPKLSRFFISRGPVPCPNGLERRKFTVRQRPYPPMSIYNRDYMRDEDRHRRASGPATWSVVIWLIVVNLAVYVVNNLLFFNPNRDWFGLSLEALGSLRLWTPLTFQFVHAHLWHLLANLLGLFFLGRFLLQLIPSPQVLRIYLAGGFAGGALQLAWNALAGDAIVIGASASVLAITFAAITLVPYQRVNLLLFFIIPVSLTMRQIGWIILGGNALMLLFSFQPSASGKEAVAVMAHFGGILLGWAYIRYRWHEPHVRLRPVPKRKPQLERRPKPEPRSEPPASGERPSPGKRPPFVTSDVDAILDKINEQGFQSLTPEERQLLEQSSRELSRRIDHDS